MRGYFNPCPLQLGPPPGELNRATQAGQNFGFPYIRMDQDGKNREVFATGVRNSASFNPADKSLWFTDNQVDGMGDGQPPGELNRATQAGQKRVAESLEQGLV